MLEAKAEQAITLEWVHREKLSAGWQVDSMNDEKLLPRLSTRRFSMQGTVYGIDSKQKPQGRKGPTIKKNPKT